MNKENVKKILKNRVFIGFTCFAVGYFIMSGENMTPIHQEMLNEYPTVKTENESLTNENQTLKANNQELALKVEQAKPWFDMKEEERKAEEERLQAEKKAKEEEESKIKAEKEAQEKAQKEAEEQAKKEAEAHKYETGLTYEDLARNPSENKDKLVTFSGKIIQVMKGAGYTQYRMCIDSDYDKVVLVQIVDYKLENGNILEDDIVTIRGKFIGEQSYQTVLGATMTIPSIIVDEVDY